MYQEKKKKEVLIEATCNDAVNTANVDLSQIKIKTTHYYNFAYKSCL